LSNQLQIYKKKPFKTIFAVSISVRAFLAIFAEIKLQATDGKW
jgi:hypothetical protein